MKVWKVIVVLAGVAVAVKVLQAAVDYFYHTYAERYVSTEISVD